MLNWIAMLAAFALFMAIFFLHAQPVDGGYTLLSPEVVITEMVILSFVVVVLAYAIKKERKHASERVARGRQLHQYFMQMVAITEALLSQGDSVGARVEAAHILRFLQFETGLNLQESTVRRFPALLIVTLVSVGSISDSDVNDSSWKGMIARRAADIQWVTSDGGGMRAVFKKFPAT